MMKTILFLAAVLVGCGDNIQVPECVANSDAAAENICSRFFGPDAQTFKCEADADMNELAKSIDMTTCQSNRGITCCY